MEKTWKIGVLVVRERPCKMDDYTFVFGLVKETIFPLVSAYFVPSEELFKERFAVDYKERVILTYNSNDIGFYQINLNQKEKMLTVNGIFFCKDYRGKGFGTFFMQEFEKMGAEWIRLRVWDNNPAVNFYRHLGYKIISMDNHKYLMEKECS